jgi:hypothetical protein
LAQATLPESESLRDHLKSCYNIPKFKQIVEGVPNELVRKTILELPAADRDRILHYLRELQRRETLTTTRCQAEDRGVLQAGSLARFINPDNLPESKIFERAVMKIKRVVGGLLAFCELPDGSEQTFGLHTLEPAT